MTRILVVGLLLFAGCTNTSSKMEKSTTDALNIKRVVDWQGHRGARGLVPENTVPSFLKALEFEAIKTLELDVVVSKDSVLIVSHEPWLSHHICSHPDGRAIEESEEEVLNIYQMTYKQIQQYDCGSRGNERFPEQVKQKIAKPSLADVVRAVSDYCATNKREQPLYNIEIKSRPEWDNSKTPEPEVFAQLVVAEVEQLGIAKQACIQSFDVRALQAVHELDTTMVTALLVENTDGLATNLEALGFVPTIYSPYYRLVSANLVKEVHAKGMQIIPWTVNEWEAIEGLLKLGVDGIITDYPNRIE